MLALGDKAPEFELQNQVGETVSLSDFSGRPVVLYFYPKDDTPGCTNEACGFRDLHSEFDKLNAVILGVSPDSVRSHKKFEEKHRLPFVLLSDEAKRVSQKYGVWKEKRMYGRTYMGIERTTFVIDGDGVIRHIFPKVKVAQHPESVLEMIKSFSS